MTRHSLALSALCSTLAISIHASGSASDTHFQSIWSVKQGLGSEDHLQDIALDHEGNILVTGLFKGTTNLGGSDLVSAGGDDIFVAKYNADGVHLWSKRFGSPSYEAARALAVDRLGNVYVGGEFGGSVDFGGGTLTRVGGSDAFVVSLTSDGLHRWSRRYGALSNDRVFGMMMTSSQGLVVTGGFEGNVDFGGGTITAPEQDAFVLSLDTDGNHVWSRGYGTTNDEIGEALASDNDGNIILAARHFYSDVITTNDWRTHVVKFDAGGTQIWFRTLNANNWPTDVAVDSEGNIFVVGQWWRNPNLDVPGSAYVNKFSPNGDSMWLKNYPDVIASDDYPWLMDVEIDQSDRLILAGMIQGTADFGGGPLGDTSDVFLVRMDSDGNHDVSVGFPGSGPQTWTKVARLSGPDELVLAGVFSGTLDFGSGVLTGEINWDFFLARFDIDVSLPVAITSFSATATSTGVELLAEFQSTLAVRAVNVYRASAQGDPFVRITSLFDVQDHRFRYLDGSITPATTYRYMLGVVADDGEFYSPVVTTTVSPWRAELLPNVPNPFNPRTTIRFRIPEREWVTLAVYDARGELIRVLVDEELDLGHHGVEWDGSNNSGAVVGSGVYFCKITAGSFVDTIKVMLIK